MPNWVTNQGYIELPDDASDEAKEVFSKLVANESTEGWFSNVLPCPQEMNLGIASTSANQEILDAKWLRKHSKFKGRFGTFKEVDYNGKTRREFKPSKKYLEYLTEEFGATNWLNWNCDNYGTKWDVKLGSTNTFNNRFEFDFDSAWHPPKNFFKWLSKHGIDFELNYEEPGSQFYGTYSCKNGKLVDDHFEGEDYLIYAIDSLDQEPESVLNLSEYSSFKEFKEATGYKKKYILNLARDYYAD